MSFGIALSGGGTRGAAHVGVMCALEEENMLPSSVSGTSAGSIIAGLYALGMPPHEMKDKVIKLFNSLIFLPSVNLSKYFSSLSPLRKPENVIGFPLINWMIDWKKPV